MRNVNETTEMRNVNENDRNAERNFSCQNKFLTAIKPAALDED